MKKVFKIGYGLNKVLVIFACVCAGMCVSSCVQDEDVVVHSSTSLEVFAIDSSLNEVPTLRSMDYTPLGWESVQLGTGVMLFKKQSESTYVFEVELTQGRKIKAYYELANGVAQATASTPLPLFDRRTTQSFTLSNYDWLAAINASFFSASDDPTSLAFFLKKDGTIISTGYSSHSNATSEKPRKYFAINYSGNNGSAFIGGAQWTSYLTGNTSAYSDMQERFQSFQNVFVGLDPLMNEKQPNSSIPRTMVGISSQGGSTVYILVASAKQQAEANSILTNIFGCSNVVMFDGGGSTQFKSINANYYLNASRTLPVIFAIK
jgi:hypothetical protein